MAFVFQSKKVTTTKAPFSPLLETAVRRTNRMLFVFHGIQSRSDVGRLLVTLLSLTTPDFV